MNPSPNRLFDQALKLASLNQGPDSMSIGERAILEDSKRIQIEVSASIQLSILIKRGFPTRNVKRAQLKGEAFLRNLKRLSESMEKEGALWLVCGPTGRGKTQLAVELARKRPEDSIYVRVGQLIRRFNAALDFKSSESQYQIMKDFIRPGFLVIDEVTARGGTLAEERTLEDLICSRYDSGKDTLLLSHHDLKTAVDLANPFGLPRSVQSRMSESGGAIRADWELFR